MSQNGNFYVLIDVILHLTGNKTGTIFYVTFGTHCIYSLCFFAVDHLPKLNGQIPTHFNSDTVPELSKNRKKEGRTPGKEMKKKTPPLINLIQYTIYNAGQK